MEFSDALLCFLENLSLDLLARHIRIAELAREALRFFTGLGRHQLHAFFGVCDASGRIQTGRQTEGHLIRMRDRFRILVDDAGCDQERGKPFDRGRKEALHPLTHQDAVFPGKGYYVCDRSQCGEFYIVCEISPVPRQMQCSGHHESDAAACQLLVRIRAVLLVRIDHGDA